MEAALDEKEIIRVGRFFFSKNNFDKAIQIIRDADDDSSWLIIDEIGPLELRGEGFSEVVKEILMAGNERQKIILVVREGLVDKVIDFLRVNDAVVINKISELG
jgi:nucleoside-triphosphatase THEP1